MLYLNFQARSFNTLNLFRAVIKWRGLGISPGYFHRQIEEKYNQKKSLAVVILANLFYLPRNLKS